VLLLRRHGGREIPMRVLLRVFASRHKWLHRSTILDMKLLVMHSLLLVTGYVILLKAGDSVQMALATGLTHVSAPLFAAPRWFAGSVTTILQVLAVDFGYFAIHLAFHRVPAMWEIHKVHHSAEVLTPLTWWRQHPIEYLAFATTSGLAIGFIFGVTGWLLGPAAAPFEIFHINILLVLFFATTHHLRHSGFWIAATGWLGRVIHSPAHHHIHHSTDPRHFDRNMGYALSLFDWMFGTLHVPERRGRVQLGVPEDVPHIGVLDTLLRPLRNAAFVLVTKSPAPPAPVVLPGARLRRLDNNA